MFARNVSVRLNPNSLTQFTEKFDKDVLPILRKQAGFRDAITLASDGLHVAVISIWETKEQAEAYNTSAYGDVAKALDGAPKIHVTKVAVPPFTRRLP